MESGDGLAYKLFQQGLENLYYNGHGFTDLNVTAFAHQELKVVAVNVQYKTRYLVNARKSNPT